MTDTPLSSWPKWRDDLIMHLRLRDVPGDKIGDILYEVDAHLRESGETPEEAFGNAKAYANLRSADAKREVPAQPRADKGLDLVRQILVPMVGGALLATGAIDLGRGSDEWGGWRAWLALLAGAAILVGTFATLPVDLIKDPRTGRPIHGSRRQLFVFVAASFGIIAILLFALGWLLGR